MKSNISKEVFTMIKKYGFVRVAAIVNKLKVSDVDYNVEEIKHLIESAEKMAVEIAVFPELSICGYTCQDLFFNTDLYENIMNKIKELLEFSKNFSLVFIVGGPLKIKNSLYNCAFSIQKGKIIGITPKTYIPNYSEFYEYRYFSSGNMLKENSIQLFGDEIPISNMLCYHCKDMDLCYAVEICEDLWMSNAPSNFTSYLGANLIFNLSSSNELVGKAEYRRNLVKMQASKALVGYIYASSGIWESTSDVCYSGHAMISEPCGDFKENERFSLESSILISDIDIARINHDRIQMRTYEQSILPIKGSHTYFSLEEKNTNLLKNYSKTPFVGHTQSQLEEILNIQAYALVKRMMHIGNVKLVVGISGGLDSTLAFLICIRAVDILKLPRENIIAITMPGFGTSNRTYENAKTLIREAKATFKEISIKDACLQHFKDIHHDVNTFDITYENAQARERTQILFDVANQENGIVIGTGDLSELALGWATYNGDHMSNYAVNCSIPKTLVSSLISCIKDRSTGAMKEALADILATPISPELLPLDENGRIKQATEQAIGPYILHDFFIYHFLRYGASVKKLYFLAYNTFKEDYSKEEIKNHLRVFIKRFFAQQFKRNCIPDGIKVGSISLSPRGDLRMSSDISALMYLKELEEL